MRHERVCRRGHTIHGKRCRLCRREYACKLARAWRAAHPEEAKARCRLHRARNPTHTRELRRRQMARWRAKHLVEHRTRSRRWQPDNPDRVRQQQARRKARKLGLSTAPVTGEFLALLLERQSGCCHYCREPLRASKRQRHLDHRIPLSRGGAHTPDNLCWACQSCNLRKGALTEAEFLFARETAA